MPACCECSASFVKLTLPFASHVVCLYSLSDHDIFGRPVAQLGSDVAPNYANIIKSPADLSTMRQKIASGAYSAVAEFLNDLLLLCTNAVIYNGPADGPHSAKSAWISQLATEMMHQGLVCTERLLRELCIET